MPFAKAMKPIQVQAVIIVPLTLTASTAILLMNSILSKRTLKI